MPWDVETDIVVIGAGGCGLIAALTAEEMGSEVVILEKTEFVLGNTAASAGMIPAAGTRFQREAGIEDSVQIMMADILRKNGGQSDAELTRALCEVSARLVEWLVDSLGMELSLVREFKYPGHSYHRMHAPLSRAGIDLIKHLRVQIQQRPNIYLMLKSPVTKLLANENGEVIGVETDTPNGKQKIGAKKVIIAANGYGGNPEMVKKYIPHMADALYFGYEANTGDGIKMGMELGADVACMTGFQGHASVSKAHGILVTWGGVMNGGFLVNRLGQRFGDETQGYSEYALEVIKQPESVAYYIIDEEIYHSLLSVDDFKKLAELNGFKFGNTPEELAARLELPPGALKETVEKVNACADGDRDPFGRTHFPKRLEPGFYGIKVEPALFHTQGGLKINKYAQVLDKNGAVIPNLYAGGGSAVGVSGSHPKGYMSGNGLLAALGWGKIAGEHAASEIRNLKV